MPDVGGGRWTSKTLPDSTLQPINYHELPPSCWEGILHRVWGHSTIDLTPQPGRFAVWAAEHEVGYLGICQTQAQKDYIMDQLEKAVTAGLSDPNLPICSAKWKRPPTEDDDPSTPKGSTKPPVPKKAKTTPPPPPPPKAGTPGGGAGGAEGEPSGSPGVGANLAKMLAQIKSQNQGTPHEDS